MFIVWEGLVFVNSAESESGCEKEHERKDIYRDEQNEKDLILYRGDRVLSEDRLLGV